MDAANALHRLRLQCECRPQDSTLRLSVCSIFVFVDRDRWGGFHDGLKISSSAHSNSATVFIGSSEQQRADFFSRTPVGLSVCHCKYRLTKL